MRRLGSAAFNGYLRIYNAADDISTLDSFSRWLCHYEPHVRCVSGPRDLEFSGLETVSTRVEHQDGWITIDVVGQAGRLSNLPGDDHTPSVNYSAELETDSAHLDQDMKSFRAFLRTIRISDPPT